MSDQQIDILLKDNKSARKSKNLPFITGVTVGLGIALGTGFVWSQMAPVR